MGRVKYRFIATEAFRENFCRLPSSQKDSVRRAWHIFKEYPFDPRLRTHRIHRLSGLMRRTVYAVEVEADLRAVFYLEGDTVVSFNIGTHDLYTAVTCSGPTPPRCRRQKNSGQKDETRMFLSSIVRPNLRCQFAIGP